MNQPQPTTKITVSCPAGHRLRGGVELTGKVVKCPRCDWQFTFAPPRTAPRRTLSSETRAVTDTGVMRILGDISQTPPPDRSEVAMRPCSRCHVPIPESSTVCAHCNCYVGVMPTFLQQMMGNNEAERS